MQVLKDNFIDLLNRGLSQADVLTLMAQHANKKMDDNDDAAISLARDNYCDDDVEIDDTPLISRADDGRWVSAWVWVADSDLNS